MPNINVKRFSRAKTQLSSIPEVDPYLEPEEDLPDVELDNDHDPNYDADDDDDDFLEDLSKDNFVSQSELEKQEKEREKQEKKDEKERKKIEKYERDSMKFRSQQEKMEEKQKKNLKKEIKEEDDKLFSEKGSEIYGRDRLQLIAKINQYKVLFPENKQLKNLKIKKNAKIEELHEYLSECEAIIDTDVVETFMTDTIIQAIEIVEMGSTRTKYNLKGLAKALKANPQFNLLCKQLYLKYKIFSKVPPEAQLTLLVISTAYIIIEKNKNEEATNKVYDKVINITTDF